MRMKTKVDLDYGHASHLLREVTSVLRDERHASVVA
jgi:hypothetical protein